MRRAPKLALVGALASLAGLVATGVLALLSSAGRAGDRDALRGFVDLAHGHGQSLASATAKLCDPQPYALAGVVLVVVALARKRRRTAVAVPIVLVGSALTTEALKPLLGTPRSADWLHNSLDASWPSGHSTAALALALCALLAAPRALRPVVAVLGAVFAVAVGVSTLVLAWHFPTDVLGGYFMAALWTLVAVAVLLATGRPREAGEERADSEPRRPMLWPAEVAVGLLAAAALAAVGWRPDSVASFASDHTAALAVGAVIAALALVLVGGVERVLSR